MTQLITPVMSTGTAPTTRTTSPGDSPTPKAAWLTIIAMPNMPAVYSKIDLARMAGDRFAGELRFCGTCKGLLGGANWFADERGRFAGAVIAGSFWTLSRPRVRFGRLAATRDSRGLHVREFALEELDCRDCLAS